MKPVFLNLPYSSGITCYYSFKFYLNLNSGVLKQHLVSHQLLCFFIIFFTEWPSCESLSWMIMLVLISILKRGITTFISG